MYSLDTESIDEQSRKLFVSAFDAYRKKQWRIPKGKTAARYDLAILHDPKDPQPPSNKKALNSFIKAGKALGVEVELIEKKDYARLAEYDALEQDSYTKDGRRRQKRSQSRRG